jgi:uncharacterized protein YcfL
MKCSTALLALLLATGCASHQPAKAPPTPQAEKKPDKRVILDPAFQGSLRIAAIRTETGVDNILQFQVDVENLTPAAKSITYRIDWLDRNGFSLGLRYDDLPWLLLPHETGPLTMAAPTPLARDFRLRLRPRSSPTPP